MNISIITIAYNGYGVFLSDWMGSILKQEVLPREVVIVLSKGHGMVRVLPDGMKGMKVKVIYKAERLSMGELRNIAIRNSESDWTMNVDIDDVLLDNAIAEIKELSDGADAVALKYYKKENKKIEVQRTPIPVRENLLKWREHYCGAAGYTAFKRVFNGELLLCEDTDFPNFPFLFKAGVLGMKFVETENVCAVYKKDSIGHSLKLSIEGREEAIRIIEKYAKKYYDYR